MKLLVVEDNKELNEALKQGLSSRGYTIDIAQDGAYGLELALVNEYDAIILDLNLPKKDGIEVGKKIRDARIKTPIIALTARDTLKEKLKGFESGFDDYLTKPFEFEELVARVEAMIRRSKPNDNIILKVGSIKLNPKKREVRSGTRKVSLTKIEFNILEYLLRNKGIVIKNVELIEHVWGEDSDLIDPPIRSHIKNLRKKIGDKNLEIIITIPGVGYKIE